MKHIDFLDLALRELKKQKPYYQPTAFWAVASEKIANELIKEGVENFRRIPVALDFFVPNYGSPANGLSNEQAEMLAHQLKKCHAAEKKSHQVLENFLSGKQSALADYRVLLASDNYSQLPYLNYFNESQCGHPIEQFELEGRRFSRSALNYLLGLSFLKRHLGKDVPRTVLEIGGGFGTLGEIWSQSGIADWKYIDIDIPPTQFVADFYLRSILGPDQVTGFNEFHRGQNIDINKLKPASVLCSWQIGQLIGEIDLFVNYISFQEMEPDVVSNYLNHVARLKPRWVLLRNMREGKQIQCEGRVGVLTPISSDDYLEMLPNYELIARNVHPYGFETVDGFHSELQLLRRI